VAIKEDEDYYMSRLLATTKLVVIRNEGSSEAIEFAGRLLEWQLGDVMLNYRVNFIVRYG